MRLQLKITLGFLALLGLLLVVALYALGAVRALDRASRASRQENFYSVQLGQQMLEALDAPPGPAAGPAAGGAAPVLPAAALGRFRRLLTREAGNITEAGEGAVVDSLTQALAAYPAPAPAIALARLRQLTHRMVALNSRALAAKNTRANAAAAQAGRYLLAFCTLSLLLGLALVLSVPQAAVTGLHKLAASLDHATRTDFRATVPVEGNDEVSALAEAFNRLLVQVQAGRQQHLAELLTERNRMSSIVQTLDEAVFLLDPARRVLVANPVACRLLGLPESAVVGQPAAALAAASPAFAQVLAPLLRPLAERPPAGEPLALTLDLDGQPAYFQLTLHEAVAFNPARDQMEFTGAVLALHNVSAFRQLDRTKSDFLATVSHELKTPLSSINFTLQLLANEQVGPLNPEQQTLLGTIKQENQRLLRLVGELLAVARLEAGAAVPLDVRPTAVADLVAAATAPLRLQLRPKRLALRLALPADLPAVRADLEKSAWVLLNLLANAVRYAPEGSEIILAAAPTPDGRAVRVQVQDAGPGIAPDQQARIFERFARGPAPAASPDAAPAATEGTGLGLSISREFIATQGGTLGVESAPGTGSTFFFTLPVAG